MQKHIYDLRYAVDQTEWRARAKRDLVFQLIAASTTVRDKKKLLDFGCGTGVLQDAFAKRYPTVNCFGIDTSQNAIMYCQRRGLKNVRVFDGTKIPYKNNTFDFITAIDVIEHIKDDVGALREIYRVLKPHGIAIVLVPAHQYLWSTRDIRLHHFRRYSTKQLLTVCREAGFTILNNKNVDFALFFLLFALCRFAKKKKGVPSLKTETGATNAVFNTLLYQYEQLENFAQQFATFPIGTSVVAVVTKGAIKHRR